MAGGSLLVRYSVDATRERPETKKPTNANSWASLILRSSSANAARGSVGGGGSYDELPGAYGR